MDLIITGYSGLLSDEEMGILKDGYDKVLEVGLKFANNKDWFFQARKSFKRLHSIRRIWMYFTPDQKVKESHYMYDCIFRCRKSSKSNTEWISKDLIDENGKIGDFTADHPLTARIVMRIIMKDWPPFMNNLDEYIELIDFLSQTVGISKKDNQNVKVTSGDNGEIKITTLTKDKYSKFIFKNKNTGEEINGLPFEIPDWFEKGELERLISDDEKEMKKLKKMKLEDIRKLAIKYKIDINKNNKKKSKKELIDEIMIDKL